MAKSNIWMPIYIGDYLGDTLGLTLAEHGGYLLVIFAYWKNRGPLDDLEARAIIRDASQTQCERIASFFRLEGGKWHHDRIDAELRIAEKNSNSRTSAARIASNARWKGKKPPSVTHPSRIADASLTHTPSPSPSPSLEREQHFPECNGNPTLKEVLAKAEMIGLAAWKAEDWFNEMSGCGWLDHAHRPIKDWVAVMTRVKVKWESDGRPATPPKPRTSYDPKADEKEKLQKAIKNRYEELLPKELRT